MAFTNVVFPAFCKPTIAIYSYLLKNFDFIQSNSLLNIFIIFILMINYYRQMIVRESKLIHKHDYLIKNNLNNCMYNKQIDIHNNKQFGKSAQYFRRALIIVLADLFLPSSDSYFRSMAFSCDIFLTATRTDFSYSWLMPTCSKSAVWQFSVLSPRMTDFSVRLCGLRWLVFTDCLKERSVSSMFMATSFLPDLVSTSSLHVFLPKLPDSLMRSDYLKAWILFSLQEYLCCRCSSGQGLALSGDTSLSILMFMETVCDWSPRQMDLLRDLLLPFRTLLLKLRLEFNIKN